MSSKGRSAPEPERERGGNQRKSVRLTPAQAKALRVRKQAEATRARWRNEFFEDYSNASRQWDDFRRTQNLEALREAARILEDAHERLQAEEHYWDELSNLPNKLETDNQKAEAEEVLEDFDDFLAREAEVLVRVAQLQPTEDVARLLDVLDDAVRDRDRAYRMVRFSPDKEAIKTLRARSEDLQQTLRTVNDEISAVLDTDELQRVDDPRRYRWVHAVRKSLQFLGGAGLAAYNIFLLDPSTPAVPSIIGGCQAMLQQFPETRGEKITKEFDNARRKALELGKNIVNRYRGD